MQIFRLKILLNIYSLFSSRCVWSNVILKSNQSKDRSCHAKRISDVLINYDENVTYKFKANQ